MQVFELHFNPQSKEDHIFDSFVFEPEKSYEKKLGTLYIIEEIKNAIPENKKLINNLAQIIKKNYYNLSIKNQEKAISDSLEKANQFLANEVKNNNVNWLGNLNAAILSINKDILIFSKTGKLKILLIREGEINNIGKDLDKEIEPYPLKIFFNFASGKIKERDLILVLTQDLFNFLKKENKIKEITALSFQEEIKENDIKKIFPSFLFERKEGKKISGICLILFKLKDINRSSLKNKKAIKEIKKKIKKINFRFQQKTKIKKQKLLFASLIKNIEKKSKTLGLKISSLFNRFKNKFSLWLLYFYPNIKTNKKNKKNIKKTKTIINKKIKKKTNNWIEQYKNSRNYQQIKRIILLFFVLLFFFGAIFSGYLKIKKVIQKENSFKHSLTKIKKDIDQSESFLIIGEKEKAILSLENAWQKINDLEKQQEKNKEKNKDVQVLKKDIEKKLNKLTNLEIIENPQESNKKISQIFPSFSLPSSLTPPPFSFSFDIFTSYFSNIYVLDKTNCQLIKYPHLSDGKFGLPQRWLRDKDYCFQPKSMTIDGSIWILNQDNSIAQFYRGKHKKTLKINIFPPLKNIQKIKTKIDFPYLCLLEPEERRIILINKDGELIKQFQSEKFNNLEDVAIADDGKTIWVLNGQKVYEIKLK